MRLSTILGYGVGLCGLLGCKASDANRPTPMDVCQASCDQDIACLSDSVDVDECVHDCERAAQDIREDVSSECFDAQTSRLACVADLSCAALDDWSLGDPDESSAYPCKAQDRTRNDACEGEICDCSVVSKDCTITYDSAGRGTPHCVCSPSCCC